MKHSKPQIETTEPDLITEVEELLASVPEFCTDVASIKHALFADAVERERDSPFWGWTTQTAKAYARAPELLRRLVEEVKRLSLSEHEVKLLTDFHYYEAEKAVTRRGDKAQQRIHLERLAMLRGRNRHD